MPRTPKTSATRKRRNSSVSSAEELVRRRATPKTRSKTPKGYPITAELRKGSADLYKAFIAFVSTLSWVSTREKFVTDPYDEPYDTKITRVIIKGRPPETVKNDFEWRGSDFYLVYTADTRRYTVAQLRTVFREMPFIFVSTAISTAELISIVTVSLDEVSGEQKLVHPNIAPVFPADISWTNEQKQIIPEGPMTKSSFRGQLFLKQIMIQVHNDMTYDQIVNKYKKRPEELIFLATYRNIVENMIYGKECIDNGVSSKELANKIKNNVDKLVQLQKHYRRG